MANDENDILVFAGSASTLLTAKICAAIGIEPGRNETLKFDDGNIMVRINENVRGRRIYIVQSITFPTNDNFVELLFWIDAFRRSSAEKITAVVPYFSYAKGDKKDQPRVAIRARVCADSIQEAGADRVVFMDLHSVQVQGFFKIPVDDLYAMPVLCRRIRRYIQDGEVVVVSPDPGFVKKARLFATRLGAPTAIADHSEPAVQGQAELAYDIMGSVEGKTALIVDDFATTGLTLVDVSKELLRRGAKDVFVAITHGPLAPSGVERIQASAIKKVLLTDTVETRPAELTDKFEVVSVATLFSEAIRRIHNRESISVLFDQ